MPERSPPVESEIAAAVARIRADRDQISDRHRQAVAEAARLASIQRCMDQALEVLSR